ncbi:MAG: efflux RND transporter periplasmic adaptor subunit [Acidobacteria bacterium]|nr:efflux RND transporter periplasmic adaptor subunit [Acidobacteriota bacterium]
MNRIAYYLTAVSLFSAIVLTGGCGSERAKEAPAHFAPVTARITKVVRIREQKPIEVYGIVQPVRQSFVSSRVMGPVIAVHVHAGEVVKKGQPLLEIQPQTIEGQVAQAKGALAQAEAALAISTKNFTRFSNLHKTGAASDLELDMARMQYDQAKGAVEQAKGAVQAASSVAREAIVRAPFDARVVEKLVNVGDLAAPGRPLVRVESLAGRQVWLTVREGDIHRVKPGQSIDVRFDSLPKLGAVTGTVSEIVPAADPATHTFTVKVALGKLNVSSGIAATGALPGDVTARLVIPATAVHRFGGLELVVVRDAEGKARTRAVTTGSKLKDGRIEVLSGLNEGDEVLTDIPGPVADGTPVEVAR